MASKFQQRQRLVVLEPRRLRRPSAGVGASRGGSAAAEEDAGARDRLSHGALAAAGADPVLRHHRRRVGRHPQEQAAAGGVQPAPAECHQGHQAGAAQQRRHQEQPRLTHQQVGLFYFILKRVFSSYDLNIRCRKD